MKITKFVHSCLLVETENRTALFDPGMYSPLDIETLKALDDIFITHEHPDHMDVDRIKQLRARFPGARITAPASAQMLLDQAGITGVQTSAPDGVCFFDAPHEAIRPLGMVDPPEEVGIHYLDLLTDPGDSHHFHETMPILALPLTGPWASTVLAVRVALELKPKYIVPVHDWQWRDDARQQMYDRLETRFAEEGITFIKMTDGKPVQISL
jgi:L-ascorbate metabolism protein UlaG (beta-lactamase superfamily)